MKRPPFSRRFSAARGRLAVGAGVALLLAFLAPPSPAAVRLDLEVPGTGTWVIGDAIPLHWRFVNQSTQALGFMWEGCCRLNGKLEVRAAGRSLATAPSGQALAHMFAKADRLAPAVPKSYETRIADWVTLPGTGTYELSGIYRGILPTQSPQVPRGLALWRDAAESAPVRFSVLAVDDYLAQRPARETSRGLRLSLRAPAAVPVLAPARFEVTIENTGISPRKVDWPDAVSLWVLDSRAGRIAPSAVIRAPFESVVIPAGGRIARGFEWSADALEGERPGPLRCFVDLAADDSGGERVPSAPMTLEWRLGPAEVRELVAAAARGSGTGARNAPLKLLRVHLSDVAPSLAALAADPLSMSPSEAGVAHRLDLAATLKPLSPRPGAVDWVGGVSAGSSFLWRSPEVRAALAKAGEVGTAVPAAQLRELLSLRRHLGWEPTIVLDPEPATRLSVLFDLARSFSESASELAGPTVILASMPGAPTAPPRRWTLPILEEAGVPAKSGPSLRLNANGHFAAWSEDGKPWAALPDLTTITSRTIQARSLRVVVDPEATWENALGRLATIHPPDRGVEWVPGTVPSSAEPVRGVIRR